MPSWTVSGLGKANITSHSLDSGLQRSGSRACYFLHPWGGRCLPSSSASRSSMQGGRFMLHWRPCYRGLLKHCVAMAEKMYIPNDSFGGRSPEKLAAEKMQAFFTFAACRIILAQLEGSGRGGLGSYNASAYNDLMEFLQNNPIKNGDEWLAKLMAHNELLGVRVMEVRAAYCELDFEWDEMQRLANEGIKESNVRLMRQHAVEKFGRLAASTGPDVPQEEAQ